MARQDETENIGIYLFGLYLFIWGGGVESGSCKTQTDLEFTLWPRRTLNSWSTCPLWPNARIAGMCPYHWLQPFVFRLFCKDLRSCGHSNTINSCPTLSFKVTSMWLSSDLSIRFILIWTTCLMLGSAIAWFWGPVPQLPRSSPLLF